MKLLLSQIMNDRGLTQQDVAHLTGIAQQQICRYLNGQMPNLKSMEKLAVGLGIQVSELTAPTGEQVFVCPHCGRRFKLVDITTKK